MDRLRATMKAGALWVALALLALPSAAAFAQSGPQSGAQPVAPSPQALSDALRAHGSAQVAADDIRTIRCAGASHAPGALDCQWEQRNGDQWHGYTSWLALVGADWSVLDAPLMMPDRDRGRLKPLPLTAAD